METILLLVGNPADRRLLEEHLEPDHDVIVPGGDGISDDPFDLVLAGDASFERYRDEIADRKEATSTFLPTLLVLFQRRPRDLDRSDWEFFDEIIRTPVDPSELAGRIEGLLQTRHLSLELKQERDRSERRFRVLFDDIPDPVVVLSPDGVVQSANDTFEETFAGEGERVEGRSIETITDVPDGVMECLKTEPSDVDGLPDVGDFETYTVTTADGDEMIAEVNVDPVVQNANRVEWIAVSRDVTREIERKRELERQNERLERFASFVSHDLRNPLMLAQNATRAALERYGEDEDLRDADDSLDRMSRLIEDVLALVREGKTVKNPEPVRVESAVQTAWNAFEADVATVVIGDDLPMICADEDRLVRVFENCFRNAVEHGVADDSSTGKSGVTIRVGPLADGFYVEDDGPGIPEADREDVFRRGYTTAEDGTGFGLNIVASIAEAHGWSVKACEGEEGGARFEITDVETV
ncbi:MAG TPA: PAS domain-containing sensor histidine kinase [Natrialbaceae archaeon]|nr:PAS domain-containing sensor histidine kinase [Natrialbaceae archaeon]